MSTAVSSSSPLSMLTPASASPAAAGTTATSSVSSGGATEASDFNAVLSPLMGESDAGGGPVLTADGVPATPVSALTLALPEGLELTAVLQQNATAKGNALPVDGKVLPGTEDASAQVGEEDPALQISLPVTLVANEGSVKAAVAGAGDHEAAEQEATDATDLLAQLALPVTTTTEVADHASVATVTSDDASAAANSDATPTDAQALLLSAAPEVVANVTQVVGDAAANDGPADESAMATSVLAAGSRPVAPRAETASSAASAIHLADVDDATSSDLTASDLLALPADGGKDNDIAKSGGFGRLLETQAAAATGSQQTVSDTSTLNSRALTGAVAYRMEGNAQVATTLVNQPMDSPQWSNEIGERVVWFGANKIQHAEIALDPPELGPLQVRISTQNDQTSVTFTSHHAAVREVLDQSLPRLKEMFSEQGLNLVQADVGERRGSQPQQQFEAGDSSGSGGDGAASDADDDAAIAAAAPASKMRLGLVDAYA